MRVRLSKRFYAFFIFPQSTVFVTRTHGNKGIIEFAQSLTYKTYLTGNVYSNMGSQDKALSQYTAGALSNVRLAVFMGCHTGETDTSTQNRGNIKDITEQADLNP